MPFLAGIFQVLGNVIAPMVAQMGMLLLTERVVRRVTVLTLRWLEAKAPNDSLAEAIDIIADALEVPDLSYKVKE